MADNLKDYIDRFLFHLESVKRLSNNTLISYKNDLSQFSDFIENKKIQKPGLVREKDIRNFVIDLNSENLSKSTISRKLSAIRSFYSYLITNNLVDKNPASKIKGPKISRKLPETLSENDYLELENLLDKDNLLEDYERALIKTIFEILYGSALRVSELCNLNISDVDLNAKTIRVLGKGSKERIVPIGDKSIAIVKNYFNLRDIETKNEPFLINKRYKRIYPRYVQRLTEKYFSKITDIEKKSPHIFRHSAATHMLDREADLLAVKEILGHKNLSTTQIYTHLSIERLKKAHKKAHPKS